jgi:hypothetical protein
MVSHTVYEFTQNNYFPPDALDTASNKSAIVACNKLLKKHPKNELVKVRSVAPANVELPSYVFRL